jgi:hypothetical protein
VNGWHMVSGQMPNAARTFAVDTTLAASDKKRWKTEFKSPGWILSGRGGNLHRPKKDGTDTDFKCLFERAFSSYLFFLRYPRSIKKERYNDSIC